MGSVQKSASVYPTHCLTLDTHLDQFNKDVKDVHLVYDYNAENPDTGADEKWRYEIWFISSSRIVYAIHGGPMAGRTNFQTAGYQCIRPGELWQVNWLEETGTICSLVWDITQNKLSTLIAFSKGHWEEAEAAHGDKHNQGTVDFDRWRGLATQGIQTDRFCLHEQADILESTKGAASEMGTTLTPITGAEPTI